VRFRSWGDTFLSTSTHSREEAGEARAAMAAYLFGLLDRRRAEPADDLLSRLVRDGDPAHRDPAFFPGEPDRVDLARKSNPHMAFGYGTHYCLGAGLGRLEVRTAIERLTARLPDLRLAVPAEGLRWKSGVSIRGPEELPVAWG
jgi:cytochrome P450